MGRNIAAQKGSLFYFFFFLSIFTAASFLIQLILEEFAPWFSKLLGSLSTYSVLASTQHAGVSLILERDLLSLRALLLRL